MLGQHRPYKALVEGDTQVIFEADHSAFLKRITVFIAVVSTNLCQSTRDSPGSSRISTICVFGRAQEGRQNIQNIRRRGEAYAMGLSSEGLL